MGIFQLAEADITRPNGLELIGSASVDAGVFSMVEAGTTVLEQYPFRAIIPERGGWVVDCGEGAFFVKKHGCGCGGR